MSLKEVDNYYNNLKLAKKLNVVIGLTKNKATSRIYEDGQTVVDVGLQHEFGKGNIPQRSFLRMPFIVKDGDIKSVLRTQFKKVAEEGKNAKKALGIVGLVLENIVKEAFVTKGYGQWKDISDRTKELKKSSQILIDKGILRSSITSEVRP